MAIALGALIGRAPTVSGSPSTGTQGTSLTFTTTEEVPAGGFIVLCVSGVNNTTVTASGGGLTWTTDAKCPPAAWPDRWISFISAQAPSGLADATDITLTYSGNSYARVALGSYWTGIATSSPMDDASAGGGATTDAWSGGDVVTANADDLIIGFLQSDDRSATNTAATDYTELDDWFTANGTFAGVYRIVSSTGTYDPGGLLSGGATKDWSAGAIAYKAAAGAPDPSSVMTLTPVQSTMRLG